LQALNQPVDRFSDSIARDKRFFAARHVFNLYHTGFSFFTSHEHGKARPGIIGQLQLFTDAYVPERKFA
jgi:hypothetical protein